eukprot:2545177-Prymnesium_polylepis.1
MSTRSPSRRSNSSSYSLFTGATNSYPGACVRRLRLYRARMVGMSVYRVGPVHASASTRHDVQDGKPSCQINTLPSLLRFPMRTIVRGLPSASISEKAILAANAPSASCSHPPVAEVHKVMPT